MKAILLRALAAIALASQVGAQVPGSVDPTFDPNLTGYSYTVVEDAAVQPEGRVILAGYFATVGVTPRSYLARVTVDGRLDTTFDAHVYGGSVKTVALQADGRILIGGDFYSVGGVTRYRIARLEADGTLDPGFAPVAGSAVRCLAVQSDGKILLGGEFFTVNGTRRWCMARLHPDGALDQSFDTGAYANVNGTVFSIAIQGDGKIVIGGFFTTVGEVSHRRVARLLASGAVDGSFNPDASNLVASVARQADGRIVIGGGFTNVNGVVRNGLARLHADGTLDASFDPQPDANWVTSVAVQADQKILVGGYFTQLGSAVRHGLARLHADGTLDAGFDPNANDGIESVALQADGQVLAGGQFTAIGATTRNKAARLHNDAATASLAVPDATQVLWSRGGSAPEAARVSFEASTDGGNVWTPLGAGTRIGATAHWQLTGLALPPTGLIRARGWTAGGASGVVETIASFPDATTTQPPVLVMPSTGSIQTRGSVVSFHLPETAQSGSVKVRYRNAVSAQIDELSIGPAGESAGTHSFALDPALPTTAPLVQAGGPLADGAYHVEVAYRDAVGNPESASARAMTVTVDTVTQPPLLETPASHGASGKLTVLRYTLPERAASGSLRCIFDDGTTQHVWPVLDWEVAAGLHAFAVDVSDPPNLGRIASGTPPLPEGRYDVRLEYRDVLQNPVAAAMATDVLIETTGPSPGTMILTPASPVDSGGPLEVNFAGWTDPALPLIYQVLVDGIQVAAGSSPSPQFAAPAAAGLHTLKGRIFDALGNEAEVTQTFTVLTALEGWRRRFYGTTENTGDAHDAADPHRTGIPNLVAFALLGSNQDPARATAALLPLPQIAGGKLVLSFVEPSGASGVTYGAEWLENLRAGFWQPAEHTINGAQHTFSVIIGSKPRLFMRFTVSR